MDHWPWIVGISVAMFFASIAAVTALLVWIPAYYFADPAMRHPPSARHPAVRIALRVAKNLMGAILFVAGLVMLLTPGQGLLTMLVGLTLLDFPGKYSIERWIILKPAVHEAIDALRRRFDRPPLILPSHPEGSRP